jgi:LPXTG-motif cell wall-anchored protein
MRPRAPATDLEETVRKVIGLLFVLTVSAGAFALPAAASEYPPTACILQIESGSATAGGSLSLSGSGFVPGETVPLTANGVSVGQTQASGSGTIATTVKIPANATSPVVIAAPECQLAVALGAGAVARPLAFTGSDTSPLVIIGIVAVALGTVLVFGARRRSATKAAVEAVRATP